MKKLMLRILLALALVFLLIQLIPITRTNPPVTQDIGAPARVEAVLRVSCYDCHSNETRWPWYSHVAPASWLLAQDVKEGRAVLNFSRWDSYTQERRSEVPGQVYGMVSGDLMPPKNYLLIHKDARLDSEKIEVLEKWKEGAEKKESGDRRQESGGQ